MKFHARLHRAESSREQEAELLPARTSSGLRQFRIAGVAVEAHCEAITAGVYSILLNGRPFEVHVAPPVGAGAEGEGSYEVGIGLHRYRVELRDPRAWRPTSSRSDADGPQEIVAPMPGRIVRLLVEPGQRLERHQGLLVIEAMKMQNELRAPRSGLIARVYVAEGQGVEAGAPLLRLV